MIYQYPFRIRRYRRGPEAAHRNSLLADAEFAINREVNRSRDGVFAVDEETFSALDLPWFGRILERLGERRNYFIVAKHPRARPADRLLDGAGDAIRRMVFARTMPPDIPEDEVEFG